MPDISTVAAVTQNFTAYGGDTWNLPLKFWSDTDATIPINITTYVFAIDIKSKQLGAPKISLTIGDGLTITAPNILTINKKLDLKGGVYFYDLELTLPDTSTVTWSTGTLTIIQDTTNSIGEE